MSKYDTDIEEQEKVLEALKASRAEVSRESVSRTMPRWNSHKHTHTHTHHDITMLRCCTGSSQVE